MAAEDVTGPITLPLRQVYGGQGGGRRYDFSDNLGSEIGYEIGPSRKTKVLKAKINTLTTREDTPFKTPASRPRPTQSPR